LRIGWAARTQYCSINRRTAAGVVERHTANPSLALTVQWKKAQIAGDGPVKNLVVRDIVIGR